jgi:hypothetical protein
MSVELRHYCRNPRCRTKLSTPVENEHHAFCIRGCYESFYRNRCRVCERDLRKTGKRGDANRLYCRPPRDCRTEAGKWPQKYDYGQLVGFSANNVRSAHSTGIKFGLAGNPPSAHGLRGWWWGDPVEGDLSLYDRDGLTIGRLVLAADGRYHADHTTALVVANPGRGQARRRELRPDGDVTEDGRSQGRGAARAVIGLPRRGAGRPAVAHLPPSMCLPCATPPMGRW